MDRLTVRRALGLLALGLAAALIVEAAAPPADATPRPGGFGRDRFRDEARFALDDVSRHYEVQLTRAVANARALPVIAETRATVARCATTRRPGRARRACVAEALRALEAELRALGALTRAAPFEYSVLSAAAARVEHGRRDPGAAVSRAAEAATARTRSRAAQAALARIKALGEDVTALSG